MWFCSFIAASELTRCDDHVNICYSAVICLLSFHVFPLLTQNSQCLRKETLLGKLGLEMKFTLKCGYCYHKQLILIHLFTFNFQWQCRSGFSVYKVTRSLCFHSVISGTEINNCLLMYSKCALYYYLLFSHP